LSERIRHWVPILPAAALLSLAGWMACFPNARLPFTGGVLEKERRGIAQAGAELEKLRRENRALREELLPLERMRKSALSLPREKVRPALVERLERAAAESGMTIRSISDVQENPIAPGVAAYTFNISAGCTINELEALLKSLSGGTPRFYWKSLRIRPPSPGTPEQLQLDGQLSVLNFREEGEAS